MPTSDEYVNLALKRFLSQNRMENEFRAWLEGLITDGLARIFPSSGLFTFPVTLGLATPNEIDLSPDPVEGIDNAGHVLILEGTARTQDIAYEDDGINVYWVGMKYNVIPSGVYNNPRTGVPEYDKWKEEVGEVDFPTSVADGGGGTIVINVNSIFESGVDHSGREVLVWLVNPVSGDPAVAFETATVAYAAPNNTITTTGSLGQGAISIVAANYKVAALGVTIRKNPTNPFGSEYVLLASIDSTGPSVTDQALQLDLSGGGGHSLQAAYDGSGGAGSGRIVTVDDEAILLSQANVSIAEDDIMQAVMRFLKNDTVTDPIDPPNNPSEWECGIDAMMRFNSRGSLLNRVHYWDWSGNDELRESEDVSVSGGPTDILTFDRGAVDLALASASGAIWEDVDIVELYDSASGNDGIYIVRAVTGTPTNTLQLWQLDHVTAAVLATEASGTLKARLYRPLASIGGNAGAGLAVRTMSDLADDVPIAGGDKAVDILAPAGTGNDRTIFHARRVGDGGLAVKGDGDVDIDGTLTFAEQLERSTALTEFLHINGGDGFAEIDLSPPGSAPPNQTWVSTLSANSGFDALSMTVSTPAQGKKIYYPFRLPHGVEIKSFAALVKDKGGTSTITMKMYKSGTHTWSTGSPALAARAQIGATQTTTSSGSLEMLEVTGLSETVDAYNKSYCIECEDNEDPQGAIIYQLRIEYEWTNVRL